MRCVEKGVGRGETTILRLLCPVDVVLVEETSSRLEVFNEKAVCRRETPSPTDLERMLRLALLLLLLLEKSRVTSQRLLKVCRLVVPSVEVSRRLDEACLRHFPLFSWRRAAERQRSRCSCQRRINCRVSSPDSPSRPSPRRRTASRSSLANSGSESRNNCFFHVVIKSLALRSL